MPLASLLDVETAALAGDAPLRTKKRLKEGEASIVVFGVETFEELELALVDLDQKEEKKVEDDGVEEEVVAEESVGDSKFDSVSARVVAVALCPGEDAGLAFTAGEACNSPFEEEIETSEMMRDGFRDIIFVGCAGVEDVGSLSSISSVLAFASASTSSSLTLPRSLLPVAWLVALARLARLASSDVDRATDDPLMTALTYIVVPRTAGAEIDPLLRWGRRCDLADGGGALEEGRLECTLDKGDQPSTVVVSMAWASFEMKCMNRSCVSRLSRC